MSLCTELYAQDVEVWLEDATEGWILAVVSSVTQGGLTLRVGHEEVHISLTSSASLPPLRNPAVTQAIDDMTQMSYLHEPAVLNCIKTRYTQLSRIYTYSGIVLIAVNPFQTLPIYSLDVIHTYAAEENVFELEPHIYAIANGAYRQMSREMKSQSIICSGESGSGKTVSARYIMQFLAAVSGVEGSSINTIENQILASNPIMEAMGNAKTSRNDNSSRFGKFIQIQFTRQGRICGALMRTYLLEKSRVISHAFGERNYHIFYQLLQGSTLSDRESLGLREPSSFPYTSLGGDSIVRGVDDAQDFASTRRALTTVGVDSSEQHQIMCILAAVLHIGCIAIMTSSRRDRISIANDDFSLNMAASLLGVDSSHLCKWIINTRIVVNKENVISPMSQESAIGIRDAFAKFLYERLFHWLAKRINESMAAQRTVVSSYFIGILDIYGFESFKTNSFEQLCINYTNENLQQQFNKHVFRLEQEEYQRENIDWQFIEFSDNKACLELIEGKMGIIAMLDEECRMPKGDDCSFAQKLYNVVGQHDNFSKPKIGRGLFRVVHYAAEVVYDTAGFVEKNRDKVPDTLLELVSNSTEPFVASLFDQNSELITIETSKRTTLRNSGGKKSHPTVATLFKASLNSLMTDIFSTSPHYIRCIKPNMEKEPFTFNSLNCLEQLRACGVLETIRISTAGYPSKLLYEDFLYRYDLISPSIHRTGRTLREIVSEIISSVLDVGRYQLGETKVFMRAGEIAFLEKARWRKVTEYVVSIQSNYRRHYHHTRYLRLRAGALLIQSLMRGKLARDQVEARRRDLAALKIQTCFRMHSTRSLYCQLLLGALHVQCVCRGMLLRIRFVEMRQQRSAIRIQAAIRCWLARAKFIDTRRKIIHLQCLFRRRQARATLRALRIEAKSMNRILDAKYTLENKVIELQQKLEKEKSLRIQAERKQSIAETSSMELLQANATISSLRAQLKEADDRATVAELEAKTQQHLASRFESEVIILTRQARPLSVELSDSAKSEMNFADIAVQTENIDTKSTNTALRSPQVTQQRVPDTPETRWRRERDILLEENRHLKAQLSAAITGGGRRSGTRRISHLFDDIIAKTLVSLDNSRANVVNNEEFEDERDFGASPGPTNISPLNVPNKEGTPTATDRKIHLTVRPKVMFKYNTGDTQELFSTVYDMLPTSCLDSRTPAMILFNCLRYDIYHARLVQYNSLCNIIEEKLFQFASSDDASTLAFWLVNHGEFLAAIAVDTSGICEITLKLQEMLNNYVNIMYKRLIEILQNKVTDVLEGMLIGENTPEPRSFIGSLFRTISSKSKPTSTSVVTVLDQQLQLMNSCKCSELFIGAVFSHIFKYIDAQMFNLILMRRDVCTFEKGVSVSFSHKVLIDWASDNELPLVLEVNTFEYINQAVKLLLCAKSSPNDVATIVMMCPKLTSRHFKKILFNFHDPLTKERISPAVVEAVVSAAKARLSVDGATPAAVLTVQSVCFPIPSGPSEYVTEADTLPSLFARYLEKQH